MASKTSAKRKKRIGIVADTSRKARNAKDKFYDIYDDLIDFNDTDLANARRSIDVMVVLGGDGFMLRTMHEFMHDGFAFYGINCGSIGFLMNEYMIEDLVERIEQAVETPIHPLFMKAICVGGEEYEALAINEVSLLRQTRQTAAIRISLDENTHMEELMCDGVLLSSPAGSSAYNYASGGPILPLNANLLALTPISAFRPRRWKGALIPHRVKVKFDVLRPEKRPVSAVADFTEIRNVVSVEVEELRKKKITLLFDPDHSLEERILKEQFVI